MDRMTLSDTLATGQLDDFIIEAEADGMAPGFEGEFAERLERLKAPRPEPRTSDSRAR